MKKILQKGFTLIELIVVIAIVAVAIAIGVTAFTPKAHACFLGFGSDCNLTVSQKSEAQSVKDNQDKLYSSVPLPQLSTSLERLNIKKRLELWNDESKVSYIYLINYGRVMAFYTVKGKITSGNKRLTSTDQIMTDNEYNQGSYSVIPAPELDGTYGSSAPYVFFWTTDGVYVQWSGDYMLVDQPLQLTSQPELVRTVK